MSKLSPKPEATVHPITAVEAPAPAEKSAKAVAAPPEAPAAEAPAKALAESANASVEANARSAEAPKAVDPQAKAAAAAPVKNSPTSDEAPQAPVAAPEAPAAEEQKAKASEPAAAPVETSATSAEAPQAPVAAPEAPAAEEQQAKASESAAAPVETSATSAEAPQAPVAAPKAPAAEEQKAKASEAAAVPVETSATSAEAPQAPVAAPEALAAGELQAKAPTNTSATSAAKAPAGANSANAPPAKPAAAAPAKAGATPAKVLALHEPSPKAAAALLPTGKAKAKASARPANAPKAKASAAAAAAKGSAPDGPFAAHFFKKTKEERRGPENQQPVCFCMSGLCVFSGRAHSSTVEQVQQYSEYSASLSALPARWMMLNAWELAQAVARAKGHIMFDDYVEFVTAVMGDDLGDGWEFGSEASVGEDLESFGSFVADSAGAIGPGDFAENEVPFATAQQHPGRVLKKVFVLCSTSIPSPMIQVHCGYDTLRARWGKLSKPQLKKALQEAKKHPQYKDYMTHMRDAMGGNTHGWKFGGAPESDLEGFSSFLVDMADTVQNVKAKEKKRQRSQPDHGTSVKRRPAKKDGQDPRHDIG